MELDVDRSNMTQEMSFGDISRKLLTADWERGIGWQVFNGSEESIISRDDFLNGSLFSQNPGTLLVIESAHLQEQQGKSLAQVYTRAELENIEELADKHNVLIKAFPAKMSPRARREIGDVSKEDDMKAIFSFVQNHPEVGLMKWRLPSDKDHKLWAARETIREDMNLRLNQMRVMKYKDHPDVICATKLLQCLYTQGFPEASWKYFKFTLKNKGRRIDFNPVAVMSIYVAVFDDTGNLRVNDQGKFIGLRGTRGLIQLSPYHFKSGTARSNLMWHTLRNALHEKQSDGSTVRNPEGRREFTDAVNGLIKFFRDSDRPDSAPWKQIVITLGDEDKLF